MPSLTGVLQEIWSFGIFSISTRHIRQLPSTARSGCQQKRGMRIPSSSAAWMTVVPAATSISFPSIVHLGMSYLSSSPAMTLSPPKVAIASASIPPRIMWGNAW